MARRRLQHGVGLEQIVDSVMDAIVAVDSRQRVVLFNPAAEAMFGLPAAEALGASLDRFLPERFREAHRGHVDRFGSTGSTRRSMGSLGTLMGLRADGTEFPLEATISQVGQGRDRLYTVVVRDVTERSRLESRLRLLARAGAVFSASLEEEQILHSLVDFAAPGLADRCWVHVQDQDGVLRLSGAAPGEPDQGPPSVEEAAQLAGVVVLSGRSELIGEVGDREEERWLRDLGAVSLMVAPLQARGRTFGALTLLSTDPGRRFGEADLCDPEELASRAAMALDNARLYEELREADRRKDRFLAMLAHELRNPLGAISNALHVMRRVPPGDPRGVRGGEIIERQLGHQVRLVDDLLDVTRMARESLVLDLRPLDLVALVGDTAEDYRSGLEMSGLRLELDLPGRPLWVRADATRLAQVLGNLLSNARKFTDPGGGVTLRVEVTARGESAAVHVADTGVGIDEDLLPHVFDLFAQAEQTLARSRGGLGLGLALVRGLVALHGGTVAVTSRVGEGSTFSFSLPVSVEEAGEASSPQEEPFVRRVVLVVEDNPCVAESLRDLLEILGHAPTVASDGLRALQAARSLHPSLILCDLGLPMVDGHEVARRLREDEETRSIPLVALTGYGQEEDRRRSAAAGFDVHLTKPLRLADLQEVLARVPRSA